MKLIRIIRLSLPLIVLGLLFATTSARADVVIYRVKNTGKLLGASNEITLRAKGFVIFDPDTRQGYTIQAATVLGLKFFTTATFTNTRIYRLNGARGKTYTAFASSVLADGQDKNQYSSGRNSLLLIKEGRSELLPKVIVGSGATVISSDPEDAIAIEGKATAVFSSTDTKTANANVETVDDAYQRIKADLEAQGYTEFAL
jgi:hypothetical protein